MSDLISRSAVIEDIKECYTDEFLAEYGFDKLVEAQQTVEAKPVEWIPCSERLPEEHDSMFKKFKGTNKWKPGMFESISNEVNVTIKFEDGKTATTSGHTVEGLWSCEREYVFGTKVIAWMPLPESYKEDKNHSEEKHLNMEHIQRRFERVT